MNVPDPKIFRLPDASEPERESGTMRLVYHGTMAHRLGVDLLIQAVARVKASVPGVQLHLWGHGDDLPAFRLLATDLGVQDVVHFNAGHPLHELPERLRVMDLGVVGNRRSAACDLMLPVKLLEYVSLGIPTVVPRLRTIEHYFTNDMVTYYEPEDVDSLADAIRRLNECAEIRRRQAVQAQDFLARYGWERQGQELVAMYRTLVEN
jgi:glycosyltransferase involved in cell wall biosynthesis